MTKKEYNRLIKKIEDFGWAIHDHNDDEIYLSQYSPLGEDFGFYVDKKNIIQDIKNYAYDFDDQEHTIINGNVCYKEDELDCSCEFIDFSIESVVYSIVKIDNELEEDFVKKYNID